MTEEAVQFFADARSRRPAWPSIPDALKPDTIARGYKLQHDVHARRQSLGDARIGWKVGCTSVAGQRSFGLQEPVYAGLFASGCSKTLAEALERKLKKPSLECEIAVILQRDLDGGDPALSAATAADAIASCHIACEIIDARYDDPAALGVPSLLADDFFQAGFVVGPQNAAWRTQDLAAADGFIEIDGSRATGAARDVLSAYDSLVWLARALARDGVTLRAGDIVLTGTLVPPTPIVLPAKQVTLGITGFAPLSTV
jgi:2-keto-4-pentenoate hydratase